MATSETALRAINAYGGIAFWESVVSIDAVVSAKGLAFTLKGRPFLHHATLHLEVKKPFSCLTPVGRGPRRLSGVMDGEDTCLLDPNGVSVARREVARAHFRRGRRDLYWDALDFTYFANYAFWNYLTLPMLLMNETIVWEECDAGVLGGNFPVSIPTHSRRQMFRFDVETGLLIQHDYTVDIISRFATAANVVMQHERFGDCLVASRRRVTPRKRDGIARNGPVLIDLTIHEFHANREDVRVARG